MEDKTETVKDKVVGSLRRNKVRIAYYTAGFVVGAVTVKAIQVKEQINYDRLVWSALDEFGEWSTTSPNGFTLTIKEATKS